MIEILGHQHLRQQSGGAQPFVDDVRWHRRPDQRLGAPACPPAADVQLDGEGAGSAVNFSSTSSPIGWSGSPQPQMVSAGLKWKALSNLMLKHTAHMGR